MNRPYIFCHMLTSLDGKIMGNYMESKAGAIAGNVFYDIAFGREPYYKHQGWISGRITTDDNFTFYKKPQLDENCEQVPEGDFLVNTDKKMYYVSIDTSGKLGWEDNKIQYVNTTAYVIEVLTNKTSNVYKDFLRKMNIPYILCGENELDYKILLEKLKTQFGIETLMLGGGGVLNWSFIQAGMCDEISIVIAASADGSNKTQTLFQTKEGLTTDKAIDFELISVEKKEGDSIWLRYKV